MVANDDNIRSRVLESFLRQHTQLCPTFGVFFFLLPFVYVLHNIVDANCKHTLNGDAELWLFGVFQCDTLIKCPRPHISESYPTMTSCNRGCSSSYCHSVTYSQFCGWLLSAIRSFNGLWIRRRQRLQDAVGPLCLLQCAMCNVHGVHGASTGV